MKYREPPRLIDLGRVVNSRMLDGDGVAFLKEKTASDIFRRASVHLLLPFRVQVS